MARQHADIFRAARLYACRFTREVARHHQPLRVQIHDVITRRRQLGVGDQIDVDPGVHAQAGVMTGGDGKLQRIEGWMLRGQRRTAGFEPAHVIGIAPSPHLNEQRVETGSFRRVDERDDRGGRGQRSALDPERANLVANRGDSVAPRRDAAQRQEQADQESATTMNRRVPDGGARAGAALCLRQWPRALNRAPSEAGPWPVCNRPWFSA